LLRSPLCQKLVRDGVAIDIQISYDVEQRGWILEVIDQEGGWTAWNEAFPTDQSALDAALLTVETDGVASFLTGP
jgi:hypothetical protein